MTFRMPWETDRDRVNAAAYETAVKRLADREERLDRVRQYLIPMAGWGLDDHTMRHINMMLWYSDFRGAKD